MCSENTWWSVVSVFLEPCAARPVGGAVAPPAPARCVRCRGRQLQTHNDRRSQTHTAEDTWLQADTSPPGLWTPGVCLCVDVSPMRWFESLCACCVSLCLLCVFVLVVCLCACFTFFLWASFVSLK
ncbi:hypothetical protein EYF80_068208 [Liparis tanakae]|uniref:Uncharacterized protein n=1 Tax=Liparis tanakae TaxID=230148 RepID=A0A4Z2DZK6_9TELE|nr:hypothetical protein EYF80_068208 [Liparis tanakae]